MKYPAKDLTLSARHGAGGTVAVAGSEFYGFCGITLISEPYWERARSQRAALNLPKMEQITAALLFNNGDTAWRGQIHPAAPRGAEQPSAAGQDTEHRWGPQGGKRGPASLWSL